LHLASEFLARLGWFCTLFPHISRILIDFRIEEITTPKSLAISRFSGGSYKKRLVPKIRFSVSCSSLLCLWSGTRYYRLMPVEWKNYIVSDPEILRGKPRLKGTRIPVGLVLGYLADGKTADIIVAEFPDLTRDQIAACLDYARELAEFEAIV